jgi:cell surface protein SprA
LDITGADSSPLAHQLRKGAGFGIRQKVNERRRRLLQFDINANIDAGNYFHEIRNADPDLCGISHNSSTPEYDPYDLDIKLKDKLNASPKEDQDSIKKAAVDETTIKTVTLTNVKKLKLNNKKPRFWDISNLDFNYSFTKINRKNPLIDLDEIKRTRGAISYNYAPRPKYFEPFKNLIKSNSKWLSFIKILI